VQQEHDRRANGTRLAVEHVDAADGGRAIVDWLGVAGGIY
jgi:hypothetical protein